MDWNERHQAETLARQELEKFRSRLSEDRNVRAAEMDSTHIIVTLKKRKSRRPYPKEIWILHRIELDDDDVDKDEYFVTLESLTRTMEKRCADGVYLLETAVENFMRDNLLTEAALDYLKHLRKFSYAQLLKEIGMRRIP
jgi:hypothetical protein